MAKPDFLCIGAQRAGTTWLHRQLSDHPQIWLPRIKELHYFDRFQDSSRWKRPFFRQLGRRLSRIPREAVSGRYGLDALKWDFRWAWGRRDDRWYQRLFEGAGDLVAGEITPAYSILEKEQVARVKALNPELKILFVLRNPIDRAWSQAVKDLVRDPGRRSIADVGESRFLEFFESPACDLRSNYLRTCENWSAFFDASHLQVSYFEDMVEDPLGYLRGICSFLAVDPIRGRPETAAGLSAPVNQAARQQDRIPDTLLRVLAGRFLPMLEQMEARDFKYAREWRAQAESILTRPPAPQAQHP
jgi:hypothetical protein